MIGRKLLGKYFVGDLQRNAEDLKENYASIEYSDGDQETFYLTLKQRVETYFRKHKVFVHIKRKIKFLFGKFVDGKSNETCTET